jgi:hypothetical protein
MPMIRVKVSMLGHVESLKNSPVLLIEIRQFLRPVGQQNNVRGAQRWDERMPRSSR